jgi:hypothetical protein
MKSAQLLNMPPPIWVYVEDLKATGLFGNSTAGVIRYLVSEGIQRAIGQGLIKLRHFDTDTGEA